MKAFARLAAAYSPNRPVVALSQRLTATPNLCLLTRCYTTSKIISRASTAEKQPASRERDDYVEPARSSPVVKNGAPFQDSDQFGTSLDLEESEDESHNWSKSFHGLSEQPFAPEVSTVLLEPLDPNDIEIKPDGLLYLPEIKYRRILNKAFGPGGWGLAPRGEHSVTEKNISREYALVCHGRFVSQARGEQDYFDPTGLPTAVEGCKSNALMRCCKDLGIASELWDPNFIRKFKKKYCVDVWVEHVISKKKKKLWRRKDNELDYPYKESNGL